VRLDQLAAVKATPVFPGLLARSQHAYRPIPGMNARQRGHSPRGVDSRPASRTDPSASTGRGSEVRPKAHRGSKSTCQVELDRRPKDRLVDGAAKAEGVQKGGLQGDVFDVARTLYP
jgi:hypothetical protein